MGDRPRNSTKATKSTATSENAGQIAALLAQKWPDAKCELDHGNPYELLVATILSAQSTDKMINTITPALFAKYPDATALAGAEPGEVEQLIFKSGFYRNKTKSLLGMARALVEKHDGQVPGTLDELVEVPGVGRKTANVVLGNAMGKTEGVVVDTHVMRLSQRLGLTTSDDPIEIEQDLMALLPREQWTPFANRLIWHGRRVCFAKNPDHENCILAPLCPSATIVTIGKTKKATKPVPATKKSKLVKKKTAAKRARS
ncbi:MAG TPA: endonuclease III [Kofleriaceae bacterium]|nr:endonuclease III [Kofleriaceae bacterium]